MRLLVARPAEDAARTAETLRARGHHVLLSPLQETEWLDGVTLPDRPYQAVLVTSANAARALARHPERERVTLLPCLAVGDRTAKAARRAGFTDLRSASGAVPELAALAERTCRPEGGPLLYAAGEARAGDLDRRLRAAGFSVDIVVLYRMRGLPRLSAAAAAAITGGALDGVLLYSRRSASAFAEALADAGLMPLPRGVRFFCLSGAVAEGVAGIGLGSVILAARPDEAHLLAAIDAEAREPSA